MTAKEFIESIPDRSGDKLSTDSNTVFHFDLSGDGGGQFTVSIVNGKCDVSSGFIGTPKCVVTTKDETLMNVVRGNLNPMMALMTGKLKVSNTGELMKYATLLK